MHMLTANPTFSNSLSFPIHHFHIPHNTPCLPFKILHNLCFPFLLGIKAVLPRETNDNAFAKRWAAITLDYGDCGKMQMVAINEKHMEICGSIDCGLNVYVTQFNARKFRSREIQRYRCSQNNMYLKNMWMCPPENRSMFLWRPRFEGHSESVS